MYAVSVTLHINWKQLITFLLIKIGVRMQMFTALTHWS